ncbi:MAG: hypothetical protein SPI18_05510 [Prevotella sp.]|nr:hypothetical protein [Prevotella sp.]MDY6130715.1 hypothetical protein [Prevotella sp.]
MKKETFVNRTKRMAALLLLALPLQLMAQTNVIKMTTTRTVGDKMELYMEFTGSVTIKSGTETIPVSTSGDWLHYELKGQDVTIEGDVTKLICHNNSLTKLNVSGNTKLEELFCYINGLTELDVSRNTNLTYLHCDDNQITTLDVSACTKLNALSCQYNKITTLNVGSNTELSSLDCSCNPFPETSVTALLESLPDRTGKVEGHLSVFTASPAVGYSNFVFTPRHVMAAAAKGWTTLGYDGGTILYPGIYVPGKEYTTLCSHYILDFTGMSGIEAYVVSAYDKAKKSVTLTKVEKVPANTGLLIKATAGNSYQLKATRESASPVGTNLLKGVTTTGCTLASTDGTSTNFVLNGGKFVKVKTDSDPAKNIIDASKAYLQLPTADIAGAKELTFTFEGETTAIDNAVTESAGAQDNGAWYTLDGRKVSKPTKGVYVRNGKKVIF